MNIIEITEQMKPEIIETLKTVHLFKALKPEHLVSILKFAELRGYDADEVIFKQGDDSDHFILILSGSISIYTENANGDRHLLTTLEQGSVIGEIGVMLQKESSVTAVARQHSSGLKFANSMFFNMFEKVPHFGLAVARDLAARLEEVAGQVSLPQFRDKERSQDRRVTDMLPLSFIRRHRLLPVRFSENRLTIGFVEEPTSAILDSIYKQLPGMEIQPVRINADYFNGILRSRIGADEANEGEVVGDTPAAPKLPAKLSELLAQTVSEGASDLHLSDGRRPRWRIDGDLQLIEGAEHLGSGDVMTMFSSVLDERKRRELLDQQDTDLGLELPEQARIRVNLYRDLNGVSASIRQIPSNILQLEHLPYPETFKKLCAQRHGLVLVTGPTGSGKSTTLASMIDYINRNQSRHIITLEDPIEYVHAYDKAVINQREIGGHTPSFKRGIRAALREDPDVILVGEVVDTETMELTIGAASSGHLVFSTMHTSSAPATVDRIIDMFPHVQHDKIRATLSDVLKGVVCQTLCKCMEGGRVVAMEIMVVNRAIANLIRESKTVQIPNAMQTTRKDGQVQLNHSLNALVSSKKVSFEEALQKSADPVDLASRLKRPLPQN